MMDFLTSQRRTLFGVLYFLILFLTVSASAQTVRPIDEKGLTDLVKNRNGKILVLNIWATWCIPCREEFPDLAQLSDSLKNSGVEVVAVSVDYPDEISSRIVPFLKTMYVPFRIYVSDVPSQDRFFALFDKEWGGAIPATFIYDEKGNQRAALIGKRTYRDFKNAIDTIQTK
ncbi:MAG: TlpA disulfide reductase family protein [Bacteroidota bacterium]